MIEQLTYAAASHVGLVRDNNEDNYAIVYPGAGYPMALILADGMGGHNKGEVASRVAVDFLAGYLREDLINPQSSPNDGKKLLELIKKANVKVYLTSIDDPECKGMGTTLTAALLRDHQLTIAHVGDCRAYLLHNKTLKQLTVDHTLVQQMVESGNLTAEETSHHPQRNILTRALGLPEFVSPDISSYSVRPGDTLILCSDGLHGFVDEHQMVELLNLAQTPDQHADALVAQALAAGGQDNVTVLIAHIPNEPAARTKA